jgi:hypothetical protein
MTVTIGIMKSLKYFVFRNLHGPLGLLILSAAFTHRLGRIVNRSINLKIMTSFSFPGPVMSESDQLIISRLIKFWNSCQDNSAAAELEDSPWNEIQNSQTNLIKLMEEENLQEIYNYLISSPTQSISDGVLQGNRETKMLKINQKYRYLQSRITVNRFACLLEGIGRGSLVQNPEQGEWGIKKDFNFMKALQQLDDEFGFEVKPPTIYAGLLQTLIGNRNFNQVDIMAMNASLQIRNVLKNSENKTILEIGAGSGTTAYWCYRLGLGKIQIIDLPHVALLQAFYLLKTLTDANILLYGEVQTPNNPDITIYPFWAFTELPQTHTELVFNQDSFAEMSSEVVQNYLTWIKGLNPRFMLSINHESGATFNANQTQQVNISSLVRMEPIFESVSRHPNWVRLGYVDQLWRLD